jgi:uncharacterized protein with PIN domain
MALRVFMTDSEIRYEKARCAHCEGLGCLFCDKSGSVLVRVPKTLCRHCEGTGCFYCGFTGWSGIKGKYE